MAVKLRLRRTGRTHMAMYQIVAADSRCPRDGRFIEKIGTYNPNTQPSTILLDIDRALYWTMVGAQPTDTTRTLLSREGVLLKKHLQVGVNKGAITQEQADAKFQVWKDAKNTTTEQKATAKKDAKLAAAKDEQTARIQAKQDADAAKKKAQAEAAAKAVEAARAAEAPAVEATTETESND